MHAGAAERAEIRRLVAWFLGKFDGEVTAYLVNEKVFKRQMNSGGGEAERCGDEERFCFFAPRIVWRRGSLTGSLKGLGVALARGLNPLGANTVL